jgi:hypothetical protein
MLLHFTNLACLGRSDWLVTSFYIIQVRGDRFLNTRKLNLLKPAPYLSCELELELIQTQMTQKPMLRAEVYARALRASSRKSKS